jgi:hypothetical protein
LENTVEPSADIAAAVSEAARRLTTEHDLDSTLQSIVVAASASLPGINHAGITLGHSDGRLETLALLLLRNEDRRRRNTRPVRSAHPA